MPRLTIVIPCRNEVLYLEECIHAIYNAELSEDVDMKVFVVDGMSDDGTRELTVQLKQVFPTLRLVDNTKKLTPYAFNVGIYAGGKTDFVQIVGARHIISRNYLSRSLEILQKEPSVWCVGGRIMNEFTSYKSKVIATAMSTSFGMGLGNFRTLQQSGYTDTVTSPMYPYHIFESIGFFDEELVRNQDDDFNFRVSKAGGKIYYAHEISLKYYVRGNYQGLWRQFFQYGYWKVYVNKKHNTITTLRQIVPSLFVGYLMLMFPALFILPMWMVFLPLALYFLICVLVSFKYSNRELRMHDLALVFPILHLSYGLGYLNGIFHFMVVGKKPSDKQKRLSR
jgi:GT2 family glycosyltransferase